MPTNVNLQNKLLIQIEAIFSPLKKAATNPEYFDLLLNQLGWKLNEIPNFPIGDIQTIVSNITLLVDDVILMIQNPPEDIDDFKNCLETLKLLFDTVKSIETILQTSIQIPQSLVDEFAKTSVDLINFLVCNYLRTTNTTLYYALSFLGIIDPFEIKGFSENKFGGVNENWHRHSHLNSSIHLSRLTDLITDPLQHFKDIYFPISGEISSDLEAREFSDNFFPRLSLLLNSLGFYTVYGTEPDDSQYFDSLEFEELSRTFSFRAFQDKGFDFGATMNISETPNNIYGLIVQLFGEYNFEQKFPQWFVKGNLSATSDAFSIDNNGVTFPTNFSNSSLSGNTSIYRYFETKTIQQLGSTSGSRFEINDILLNVFFQLKQNENIYGAMIFLDGIEFLVKAGDGDGFINKILPKDGIGGKFDFNIGWNNVNGLCFGGSGGLEIFLPAHINIGPLELNGLKLKIGLENGEIPITAGATAIAKLGPIIATCENMGLKLNLSFPSDGGNLGICNADFGFKLPNGIGLKIKSKTVEGGGYLNIDPEKGRYYGAVELKISKFTLSAIAIITTKAPDGSEGFSLLVLVNVTFPKAIPLSFGFSLLGIGGMLGVNRSLNADALRIGVKNGTINNIMFPENVIERIGDIITDLEQVFPVEHQRYTFGLFFLLNWGVATPLIKIKLGLILSVPEPVRLAIIGDLKMELPTPDEAVLKLNVAFAGIIDFDAKYLSFDASIYNSKLLCFSLSGDMAVRFFWGEHREMLLSVGGFHPAFSAPAYLKLPAKMERLSISLIDEDLGSLTLAIRLQTYFAITSNTVQFGARLDMYIKISVIEIKGYFGFDVLFQFKPFKFQSNVTAGLSVSRKGEELFCINMDFFIEGPKPWHAKGHAEFKVLGFKAKANFEKTWGDAPETSLPSVDIKPLIEEALNKKESVTTELPTGKDIYVQLFPYTGVDIIVDPLGELSITQNVVPLGLTLERFGPSKPSTASKYVIKDVKFNTVLEPNLDNAKENFAPAQFKQMNDEQKLKAASFEYLNAGVKVKSDSLEVRGFVVKELEYETIIIDRVADEIVRDRFSNLNIPKAHLERFIDGGLIGKNPISVKTKLSEIKPLFKIKQESHTVVSRDTLTPLTQQVASVTEPIKKASMAETLEYIKYENPSVLSPYIISSIPA